MKHGLVLLMLTVLWNSAATAQTNRLHINHCGDSNAANISIQVFDPGSDGDSGGAGAADASGLLHPGQGIDLECERSTGRDYCSGELRAGGGDQREIISRSIKLEDGEDYYVCADPEAGELNIDSQSCDCAFIGG